MRRSRLRRASAVAFLLVFGGVGLAGCEFSASAGAQCSSNPPVPHHDLGFVGAAIDVPWVLHPGERFTVTVNDLGSAGPFGDGGTLRSGALQVTGPVTPNGAFAVGERLVGFEIVGEPYPNELEFEVTGQPGDSVLFSVDGGRSFHGGQFPNGFFLSCGTQQPVEIARIQIVEPEPAGG